MSSVRLCTVASVAFTALLAEAAPPASVGVLDERALTLHEAWAEARLSMKPQRLEQEWKKLVESLKASLKGKARIVVAGTSENWEVILRPLSGSMSIRANPTGTQLIAGSNPTSARARTLLSLYPLRRHYDCEGRPLNPSHPGIPVAGKPCAPPAKDQWQAVTEEVSNQDAFVVQPIKGLACCYRIVSETKGILIPGQILVEQAGQPYVFERLADDKLRARYAKNRLLFVMDRKQPKIYTLAQ